MITTMAGYTDYYIITGRHEEGIRATEWAVRFLESLKAEKKELVAAFAPEEEIEEITRKIAEQQLIVDSNNAQIEAKLAEIQAAEETIETARKNAAKAQDTVQELEALVARAKAQKRITFHFFRKISQKNQKSIVCISLYLTFLS